MYGNSTDGSQVPLAAMSASSELPHDFGPGISDDVGSTGTTSLPERVRSGTLPQPARWGSIDYQFSSLTGSTSYEFGTIELPPEGWAPLSRLDFALNSSWHGLRLRWDRPDWEVSAKWLTPAESGIHGELRDYDWLPPNPDSSYTDLGTTRERWINGQMLEIRLDVKLMDELLGSPIEVWPLGGFRWQRFHLMCYDLVQVKEGNVWPDDPYVYAGDVIDFQQDYYCAFAGAQLCTLVTLWSRLPTQLTLEFDAGFVAGRNTDFHVIREGERYTYEATHGGSGHLAFTAEFLVTRHLSLGCQIDHLQLQTSGTHRLVNWPLDIDVTSDHGVHVWSEQTWATVFACYRI